MHRYCVQLHYFPTGVYTCLRPAQHPHAAVFRIPLPPYTNHRRPVSSLPTKLTIILPSITTELWASFWIIHK